MWKFGARRAAMLWERLLDEKTLSDVDGAALNEIMSLTWYSGRKHRSIQLYTQQPAEFDVWLCVQPVPGGHPTSEKPADFDFWPRVQPAVGGIPSTQQPAKFDVWTPFQPKLGGCPITQLPAGIDVWRNVQQRSTKAWMRIIGELSWRWPKWLQSHCNRMSRLISIRC